MDEFQNETRHKIWVQDLINNTSDGGIIAEQLEGALDDWANTTAIDYDSLHSRVKLSLQSKVRTRHQVVDREQSAVHAELLMK